ncbi:MAG: hypothetical protein GXP58_04145 [Deltaproteobacteria bacterium]|nr:hypothetical protein [Deltaproteobacteria bacterium]
MNRPSHQPPEAFCLFCRKKIAKPAKNTLRPLSDFPSGQCDCGAVYVSDLTGKNGGEAMIDALATACDNDEARAFSLEEGKDYAMKVVGYDARTHSVTKRGHYKDGKARLYFIKLAAV